MTEEIQRASQGFSLRTDGRVRWITLERPEVRNALTIDLVRALAPAIDDAGRDPTARAIVLTGSGGSFCAGADLKAAMSGAAIEGGPGAAMTHFHAVIRAIRKCPRPVVAAVDGAAVGFGFDLALACDLRVVSDRAYFEERFVKLGLVPDGGGTYWLPRLVGLAKAAELMMLGERIGAEEALSLGIVNRVVPSDDLAREASALASRLAKGPPLALRLMKECLNSSGTGDYEAALDRERDAQVRCLTSRDLLEGVQAFFQKREPEFPDPEE